MSAALQTVVALMLVAAAAGYLLRCAWRTIAQQTAGGCGSCSTCAASSAAKEKPLVQIEMRDVSAVDRTPR